MKIFHSENPYAGLQKEMAVDCSKCCGLCCTALYFAKSEGFPADKAAGTPCRNLRPDFRCAVHTELGKRGLKGCLAFDCLGAGRAVAERIYRGKDYRTSPEIAGQMFDVFVMVWKLHQMRWYLAEAAAIIAAEGLRADIDALIKENLILADLQPEALLQADMEGYRTRVNDVLKKVGGLALEVSGGVDSHGPYDLMGKNFKSACLDGKDFSMALLIAANLKGCSLRGTNFLGTDMRDANIVNADLSESFFLTQEQINSAKGSRGTKLPGILEYPADWKE